MATNTGTEASKRGQLSVLIKGASGEQFETQEEVK